MKVLQKDLDEIALSWDEYNLIVQKLDREPTRVELGMFGALWSEHCGYKHSKKLLSMFPTSGKAVQVKAGEENAGVVEIGDGLRLVFKVESHNHPSAIEPFQGAATGVGGIIRDILAMGARPIALLNSLRFGPLSEAQNRYLFQGVVAGISAYGNCVGIPNVGGEIFFDESYSRNPLVNAMCLGLLHDGEMMRAAATTVGNTLMLVGAATGRDGIHGATGLASRSFDEQREMRPTVQVGDPFLEKVLIEACLEAARSGYLEGMQDLGAAGLTSSAIESAERGGMGLEIDVAMVPRREDGMGPYEVMLSESQERMLLIVKRGHERDVQKLFQRWDLEVTSVGGVTGDGIARIYDNNSLVAEVPVDVLVEAPLYSIKSRRPRYLRALHKKQMPVEHDVSRAGELLRNLLANPNICSKRMVYQQFDHEVQTNTMVKPGQADAAVLRLRESSKAIALSIDGNARFSYLEPYIGGAMAVAEACRNVTVTGAKPLAVTDCLNFGNPEKPEIYYQLEECIRGMADACRALNVPVVSGNVSLYNEADGQSIYPTPIVGAVGILENAANRITSGFQSEGDVGLLVGSSNLAFGVASLAGSEYLASIYGLVAGLPQIDLNAEALLQSVLIELANDHLVRSAHDCSEGGLAVALSECCILGGIGFVGGVGEWAIGDDQRWDAALFGENPSRVIISVAKDRVESTVKYLEESGIPWMRLGTVQGKRLTLAGLLDESIANLAEAYEGGLETVAGRP